MIKVMSFLDKMTVLVGRHVTVTVSNGNTSASKVLKVCKANSRSVLFIDVDKTKRLNTFRKFRMKDIADVTTSDDGVITVEFKTNIMPDKWESPWDDIGKYSTSIRTNLPYVAKPAGWRPNGNGYGAVIKRPMGSVMDALAVSVSTTNSAAGFPMV
jgi:hypothetical protein